MVREEPLPSSPVSGVAVAVLKKPAEARVGTATAMTKQRWKVAQPVKVLV